MTLYVGTPVRVVDRYAARWVCSCKPPEPSLLDGLRGHVTSSVPLMVHLEGDARSMRFDERDLDVLEEPGPWVAGE